MRNAIRPLLVLALSMACIVSMTALALALGPGGWGNLGERAPGVSALDGRVDVLSTEIPGKLLAGGAFTAAGVPAGNTTNDDHIAIWDGASWSPLGAGAGLNGDVRALEFDNGKIYAGGVFTAAGGNANADFLAVWDTTAVTPSWQPVCSAANPPNGGNVDALKIVGNTLYVGGAGQNWGGIPQADYLFACDLTSGIPTAMVDVDGDATGAILALAVDSNGDLYAGGNFINWDASTIGTNDADYVVKYDLPSGTPSALVSAPAQPTPGIDSTGVDSLATIGTTLFVGTDDVNVDGIPQADHVVRWDGSDWSAVGSNTANTNGYFPTTADIQSMTPSAVLSNMLWVSGNWQNADGDPLADSVARFDGFGYWQTVGHNGAGNGPLNGNLNRGLAEYHNAVIVGGNSSDAGGDPLADFIGCSPFGTIPCVQPPPTVTTPPPAVIPAPTGRRAAALKKCKKKRGRARANCKKKAKKLPV